jgi:hypothetical protein
MLLPVLFIVAATISANGDIAADNHTAPVVKIADAPAADAQRDFKRIAIPVTSFVAIKELSGNNNYYSVKYDTPKNLRIHAYYVPPMKIVKLGYQLPDTCTNVIKISWDWRIISAPRGSNERIKNKNDSGASIYLMFGDKVRTQIIKYVYSETLPAGTVIKRDPFPPMQRMFIIVKSSLTDTGPGTWKHVDVDVELDYKRLYASKDRPQLKGIGILSDGDETKSAVVADYRNFILYRLD